MVDDGSTTSWRRRLQSLRYVPSFLALVWRTHSRYFVTVLILRLIRALLPVGILWVAKQILDTVVDAVATGTYDTRLLWTFVALEIGLVVGTDVMQRASTLMEGLLADLFAIKTGARIINHGTSLDLEQFEDPEFHDHHERAVRQTTGGRVALLGHLLGLLQSVATVATLMAVVLSYSVWLGVLLLACIVPSVIGETHFAAREYSLLFTYTPQRRQLNYIAHVASSPRVAKEVKLLDLGHWLYKRYEELAYRFFHENRVLNLRRTQVAGALDAIGIAGYYVAYGLLVHSTVQGRLTVGELVLLAGAFSRARDIVQNTLRLLSEIVQQSMYLSDLFSFFEMRPLITTRPSARPFPTSVRSGIVFEEVGYRYKGREEWAVRHINFAIRPDETIALLGENGAGKTTIINLLLRLYDPTEGCIMLDGVDLREYDVDSLRQGIAAVFQNYGRFEMRVDENIGVGRIRRLATYLAARGGPTAGSTNGHAVDAWIRQAAEHSGAARLVQRFPQRYAQILGRLFDGGVELSTGEWQSIALARSYLRAADAKLLVFDEPSAALDARAEYRTFTNIMKVAKGKMAVLISHRFFVGCLVDRVVVLVNGRIAEDGTHKQLIRRGGLYSEFYTLQANSYVDEPAEVQST